MMDKFTEHTQSKQIAGALLGIIMLGSGLGLSTWSVSVANKAATAAGLIDAPELVHDAAKVCAIEASSVRAAGS